MNKHTMIVIAASALASAALACNFGGGATPDATVTFGALLTQAAETAVAGGALPADAAEPTAAPVDEPTEAPAVANTLPPDVTATNTAVP